MDLYKLFGVQSFHSPFRLNLDIGQARLLFVVQWDVQELLYADIPCNSKSAGMGIDPRISFAPLSNDSLLKMLVYSQRF